LIYLERLLQGSRSFFIRLVAGHSFFMVTKQEKIALQQENPTNALAFKEGFFYKVYNQGVWLLKEKQYKVQSSGKGNLKCLYIGFTEAVMDKLKIEYKIEKTNDYYSIHTSILFDNEKYKAWCQSEINEIKAKNSKNEGFKSFESELLEEIVHYPLSIKTPIEVFTWFVSLQEKVHKLKLNKSS
jgi:hypothetical protein